MYQCPECKKFTIEVNVFTDNYGADADGNRGMKMRCAEIELQECDCDLTDLQIDKVCQDALDD